MTATADIIVIGGGIAGIGAAACLASERRVLVLEAEPHLGTQSTGRSAAIFIRNYGNATLRALNAAAHPQLAGALLGESVLSPRGELLLHGEGDETLLAAHLQGASGVDRLTVAEAQALVPALKPETFAGAVYEPDAQDIDVDRLLQGFARQARAAGAQIVTSAPVTALARTGGAWRLTTPEGVYSAPVVVNAAGAWADRIAALAGLPGIGLQPMRRSAVLMDVPAGRDVRSWPLFGPLSEGWYAKPDGGRLMISPADEDPVEPQDIWPDDMVLAEGLYRFEQMVDIPVVRPSHSWAGLRSFVADRTPVCGRDPGAEGFFWLAGQGGYGVQTAPALAMLMAALVTGTAPDLPDAVVAALSPARLMPAR